MLWLYRAFWPRLVFQMHSHTLIVFPFHFFHILDISFVFLLCDWINLVICLSEIWFGSHVALLMRLLLGFFLHWRNWGHFARAMHSYTHVNKTSFRRFSFWTSAYSMAAAATWMLAMCWYFLWSCGLDIASAITHMYQPLCKRVGSDHWWWR